MTNEKMGSHTSSCSRRWKAWVGRSGPGLWCSCPTNTFHSVCTPHTTPYRRLRREGYHEDREMKWIRDHFIKCGELALTVVAHFPFVARVVANAQEVIPGLNTPALVFAWVWRAPEKPRPIDQLLQPGWYSSVLRTAKESIISIRSCVPWLHLHKEASKQHENWYTVLRKSCFSAEQMKVPPLLLRTVRRISVFCYKNKYLFIQVMSGPTNNPRRNHTVHLCFLLGYEKEKPKTPFLRICLFFSKRWHRCSSPLLFCSCSDCAINFVICNFLLDNAFAIKYHFVLEVWRMQRAWAASYCSWIQSSAPSNAHCMCF